MRYINNTTNKTIFLAKKIYSLYFTGTNPLTPDASGDCYQRSNILLIYLVILHLEIYLFVEILQPVLLLLVTAEQQLGTVEEFLLELDGDVLLLLVIQLIIQFL